MRFFLISLILMGCPKEKDTGLTHNTETDTDTDSDADSDSDTDADSDADSDVDSDADSDSDSDSDADVDDYPSVSDADVTFTWPTHYAYYDDMGRLLETGDLNNDGVEDLLTIGDLSLAGYYGPITEDQVITDIDVTIYDPDALLSNMSVGDLNGDGYDDLVVSESHEVNTYIFYSPFDFTTVSEADETWRASYTYYNQNGIVGDQNADLLPDLLIMNEFTSPYFSVHLVTSDLFGPGYHKAEEASTIFTTTTSKYELLTNEGSSSCDFNGDGLDEIIISGISTYIFERPSGTVMLEDAEAIYPFGEIKTGDVYNSGTNNLIIGWYSDNDYEGMVNIYDYEYGEHTSKEAVTTFNGTKYMNLGEDFSLGDKNNDYQTDLWITYSDCWAPDQWLPAGGGLLYLGPILSGQYAPSNASYWVVGKYSSEASLGESSEMADLNNDGFDDMLISADNYEHGIIYIFFGNSEI